MGVDGFRFDLAAVLGNSCASACYAFAPTDPAGILERAATELPGVALVAEPWGVGNRHLPARELPRRLVRVERGLPRLDPHRAERARVDAHRAEPSWRRSISGSPDLFDHDGRAPWASIDYVDCHDGFTLHDEYAYDAPLNDQAYPLGPSPGGSTTNDSWDQGGVAAAQTQAARTGLALVALSAGVPMLQGGDEMLRTQSGNDNAYNLDDSAMWLDPTLATTNAGFVAWTKALFAFRAAHPALRPATFWDGQDHDGNGLADVGVARHDGRCGVRELPRRRRAITSSRGASTGPRAATPRARSTSRTTGGRRASLPRSRRPAAASRGGSPATARAASFAAPGQETALTATTVTVAARSVAVLVER